MLFEEQISLEPDQYPFTEKYIHAIQDNMWTHRLFNFSSDIQDFKVKLDDKEKQIIIRALATIAQLELPIKRKWSDLGKVLPHPSVSDMGITFGYNETVHSKAYFFLLKILGIKTIFDEILSLDIIKGRVNYLRKHANKVYANDKKQFIYSIILFALFIENIALFSQFYTIQWFGTVKKVLKDTNKQVEYTSREENLHAMAGIEIVNILRKEYPEYFDTELEEKILSEAKESVKYEFQIIDWILDGYNKNGLNAEILKEFIKDRLNDSLSKIGYSKIFEVNDKVLIKTQWFEEQLLGNNQTDFFHSRPVEYSKNSKSFSNLF